MIITIPTMKRIAAIITPTVAPIILPARWGWIGAVACDAGVAFGEPE